VGGIDGCPLAERVKITL